jgi:plasmid stabilization system protein ParE
LRVVLTRPAAKDLVRVDRFIARHNPRAAQALLLRLNHVLSNVLPSHPEIGTPRDDVLLGLRVFVVEDHLVCYRLRPATIRILRIVHGAQDFTRLL